MKKKLLNLVGISFILTTIGFLMDGDVKEPSMLMRFVEFVGMTGIIFLFISIVYFTVSFAFNRFQKV